MLRLGAFFIVVCMVLIAGSLGAVLYLWAGLSSAEAGLVALGTLTALALYNGITGRVRQRSDVGAPMADLSRASADIARQVAELGRRTEALESVERRDANRTTATVAPIAAELSEIGTLVKHLAEQIAAHDAALTRLMAQAQGNAAGGSQADAQQEHAAPTSFMSGDADGRSGSQTGGAALHATARPQAVLPETIRSALDANRVEIYLQPIVTLPQRKVRYYEALTRLRTKDGELLQPDDFLGPAEAAGLLPRIDNQLMLRAVQVVRRLLLKNRDIGLFCNVSTALLNEPQLFPELMQFLAANRAIAPSLVLEFRQSAWRSMGPLEQEGLAALREQGFRFCIDRVTDLKMEPRTLGEHGVRFVKASAPILLGRGPGSDIDAADLSDLLNRYGISLVADRIENEAQVVDLLDYDLRFGQGFLFSPPRPVKIDLLQGNGGGEQPRPAA